MAAELPLLESDIMLGPGHLFGLKQQPTPWMRFNVAFAADQRIFTFLERRVGKR